MARLQQARSLYKQAHVCKPTKTCHVQIMSLLYARPKPSLYNRQRTTLECMDERHLTLTSFDRPCIRQAFTCPIATLEFTHLFDPGHPSSTLHSRLRSPNTCTNPEQSSCVH